MLSGHSIESAYDVAWHFVPLYNLYWVFKWPSAIAHFVNWRMQRQALRGWIAGLLVLLAFVLFQGLGVLGLFALYGAGFYLSRHMRRAFDAAEVPDSAKESMMPGYFNLR